MQTEHNKRKLVGFYLHKWLLKNTHNTDVETLNPHIPAHLRAKAKTGRDGIQSRWYENSMPWPPRVHKLQRCVVFGNYERCLVTILLRKADEPIVEKLQIRLTHGTHYEHAIARRHGLCVFRISIIQKWHSSLKRTITNSHRWRVHRHHPNQEDESPVARVHLTLHNIFLACK